MLTNVFFLSFLNLFWNFTGILAITEYITSTDMVFLGKCCS